MGRVLLLAIVLALVAADSAAALPLSFVVNRGQTDRRADLYVQGRDASVFFTRAGARYALTDGKRRWAVEQDFIGARHVDPRGARSTSAVVSYFRGPRSRWKSGLKTYARVVYSNLWRGIDLVYSGRTGRLEYSFVVRPGADPSAIRLAYRGARAVKLNRAGQLEVSTPAGGFVDDRPVALQGRVPVRVAFERSGRGYGFRLGAYDRSRTLVIDPAVIVNAGYIGGAGDDQGYGVAVDAEGNTYVSGRTNSSETSFPDTTGPDPSFNGGTEDAFVAKLNEAGTGLVYAGYIGGAGDDDAIRAGIAVDDLGAAYLVGTTNSTRPSFPVTVGPDPTFNGGSEDAFVAKVNRAGTRLVYCGYIGGVKGDAGRGIAVGDDGSAYVTGTTESPESSFPVAVGPDLTYNGAPRDAFVAKVSPSGKTLAYAGYIGGSGEDAGRDVAVDAAGNAYVTGRTGSTEATFRVMTGPDVTYNGSEFDAYVVKVNRFGTGFAYGGYIGGARSEQGRGIEVGDGGNAYIAGVTESGQSTFPVSVGPDLTFNGGQRDSFIAKVRRIGDGLVYAGYIGGAKSEEGWGPALDASGNAYVTGWTTSPDFPVREGPDPTFNGIQDAFLSKVNRDGTGLAYSGYIGGAGYDEGHGVAVDAAGRASVVGMTASDENSFPVSGGPDLSFNGGPFDAFVVRVASP